MYILSDSHAAIQALGHHQITSKLVWDCHQSIIQLAIHNRLQLRWVPGQGVLLEMKQQIYLQEQALNIHSQDLNQPVASQLELPRERPGTGRTEITKNNGNPQLDSNRHRDFIRTLWQKNKGSVEFKQRPIKMDSRTV
jgi:hypothetical protein